MPSRAATYLKKRSVVGVSSRPHPTHNKGRFFARCGYFDFHRIKTKNTRRYSRGGEEEKEIKEAYNTCHYALLSLNWLYLCRRLQMTNACSRMQTCFSIVGNPQQSLVDATGWDAADRQLILRKVAPCCDMV